MSTITKDLGVVTAYGYAVSKGYTGTEEEFAELMASYATVAEQAAQSAETAEEAAEAAAQAVLDANAAKEAAQQSANGAANSAQSASSSASSASQSASAAQQSANAASGSAQAASTKAQEAAGSASAASESASAAQTAKTAAEDAQAAAEAAVSSLADFAPTVANTASGDIASFTDGANDYPVKDLVVDIEPVQDLHGYANPWPAGGGKNLLPFPYSDPSGKTLNGVAFTTNDVGKVHISGTTGSGVGTTYFNLFINNVGDGVPSWLKPGESYTVTPTVATGKYFCQLILYGATPFTITGRETKTLPNDLSVYNRCAFVIGVYAGATVDDDVFPAIYEGAAPTEWEPYSNICPITGWTGANVTRTGKNLLDASTCIIRNYINSRGKIEATTGWSASDYIPVKSGETYTLSNYNPSGNAARHAFYGIDKSFLSSILAAGNNTFTAPSGAYYVRVSIKTENQTGAQLELGSTATSYEPYNGDTYAVTFPTEAGTVYGGTLDVTTGVLTVDRGFVDMGTLNWQGWEESGSTIFNAPVVGKVELRTSTLICSQYKPYYTVHTWADLENGEITGGGNNNVYIRDIRYSSVANFKTAMDGVQLVYELATPVTYQCTPTEVKTILGMNNIYADTGAVEVEYCADTKKYIDNAIATAIATLS